MEIIKKKGLVVKTKNGIIGLDSANKDCDYCFLSHAHSDHLFKTQKPVLCSNETLDFAKIRNININKIDSLPSAKMVDSGHVLGSKSLIVEDDEKLLFTGDFSLRGNRLVNGLKIEKCDSLIIETTFGKSEFIFPNFKDEMKKAKDWVEENMKKNYLSVLMGYSLGKIQSIQHYFKDFSSTVHEKIKPYNEIYEKFGHKLINNVGNDILFTPPMKSNDNYFNNIKRKRGVKFAVFSGWNIYDFYKSRFKVDAGFTISDHADFKELLTIVKKSNAKNIYTHHGHSKDFAELLKKLGYNSEAL